MGDSTADMVGDVCLADSVEEEGSDCTSEIAVYCAKCSSWEGPFRFAVVSKVDVRVLKESNTIFGRWPIRSAQLS